MCRDSVWAALGGAGGAGCRLGAGRADQPGASELDRAGQGTAARRVVIRDRCTGVSPIRADSRKREPDANYEFVVSCDRSFAPIRAHERALCVANTRPGCSSWQRAPHSCPPPMPTPTHTTPGPRSPRRAPGPRSAPPRSPTKLSRYPAPPGSVEATASTRVAMAAHETSRTLRRPAPSQHPASRHLSLSSVVDTHPAFKNDLTFRTQSGSHNAIVATAPCLVHRTAQRPNSAAARARI